MSDDRLETFATKKCNWCKVNVPRPRYNVCDSCIENGPPKGKA